jgi:hypothetical protein
MHLQISSRKPKRELLVAQVLREDIKLIPDILGTVEYRQRHNRAAYLSHRKRTLERHRKASKRKKRKVS